MLGVYFGFIIMTYIWQSLSDLWIIAKITNMSLFWRKLGFLEDKSHNMLIKKSIGKSFICIRKEILPETVFYNITASFSQKLT